MLSARQGHFAHAGMVREWQSQPVHAGMLARADESTHKRGVAKTNLTKLLVDSTKDRACDVQLGLRSSFGTRGLDKPCNLLLWVKLSSLSKRRTLTVVVVTVVEVAACRHE